MSDQYICKVSILTLLLEVYTILGFLFELNVPGTEYLEMSPLLKLAVTLAPLVATFISRFVEAWSVITLPALSCSVLIPIAAVLPASLKLGLGCVAALLAIAHAKALKDFPVFHLNKPTGKFAVGYKSYSDKDNFKYCVFYPTLKPTKQAPRFMADPNTQRKYLEIAQERTNFPPKGLFDILVHIMAKVKLMAGINSPIVSSEELFEYTGRKKFVPVVFSHGLGAGMHNYSSMLVQLASQGHFVVSLDHKDEVKEMITFGLEAAQKYLHKRVKDVRRVIDEFDAPSGSLRGLFGKDVEFDMEHLTLMGHSFGGGTVYLGAWLEDKVKNLVMLDPFLWPVQQESLDKTLNCNLLILESHDWNDRCPDFMINKRNLQVMEAQKNSEAGALYCKVVDSQHTHFSDDILMVGGVMKLLNVIKDVNIAKEIYKSNIKIIDEFFSLVASKKRGEENFNDFIKAYVENKRYPLVPYSQKIFMLSNTSI